VLCIVINTQKATDMQKTILFPTDFTVASLNIVRSVLQGMKGGQQCRVILLHGYRPNDSITDLLFSSPRNWMEELSNPGFEEACEVLRNKFESLVLDMRTELYMGRTQSAFNSFLEANDVDEIHMPQGYTLKLEHKRSFDVIPFIRKSARSIHEVQWQGNAHVPGKGMVAEVFQESRVAIR